MLVVGRALAGDPAERRVDRLARGPRWPRSSGSPRGRSGATSSTRAPLAGGERRDRPDRRGLAGARAAGDQRQAVREGVADARRAARRSAAGRRRRRPRSGGSPSARSAPPDELDRRARRARPRARRSRCGRSTARRGPGRRPRRARRSATRGAGVSPSSSASAARSASSGMQVLPPRSASASRCRTPARARSGSSRRARRGRARSGPAIRNPTPNTLVSSYGRSLTTRCARVAVGLVDPRHQVGEPVRREQQVQPPRDPQPLPRFDRLLRSRCRAARRRRTRARGSASIASSTPAAP